MLLCIYMPAIDRSVSLSLCIYMPAIDRSVAGCRYGGTLAMLIFDTVVYTALGYYLELVLPKEFGTRMHPLFMCRKRSV